MWRLRFDTQAVAGDKVLVDNAVWSPALVSSVLVLRKCGFVGGLKYVPMTMDLLK